MKIRELNIHNWRSIRDETISFQDFMIFIGQNNHGKSNILSALLFFLGDIGLDILDFHSGCDELFVEIEFADLDDDDKTTFKKYVTAVNTIRVRKVAHKESGSAYHGYVQTPTEEWLREENIANYTRREAADGLPLSYLLPDSGRITRDIFKDAQEQYIQEHRASITFNYELEHGPFLGAKNVAKGIFGEVYFIPSVKKAAEDLTTKGKSVFSELYARVINKMSETNQEFKDAKSRIVALMRILNKTKADGTQNTSRPPELTAFEESIQTELDTWNTTIDVEITPPDLDDIFRVGASVWINDGIRTDITRKGQGLQRALIFALVKSLAKLTKNERDAEQNREKKEGIARQASKATCFIFEEPELFLHPQAQRELLDSLLELSQGENQVVLCTHSSAFISLDYYQSICIVRKNSIEEGTTVFQCTERLFPEGDDKHIFNMTYWINPDRGELFFAKKVILVEGATDKTIIPLLASKMGIFRHDYTVIDCGSKDSIPSYLQLLNRFCIPYVAVYDEDRQAGKSADAIAVADKASKRVEDHIDPTMGASVIFKNDIEEELGISDPTKKNKPYVALAHTETEGFAISQTLKTKIEKIYS